MCCLEISYLNDNGKYFDQIDQTHDQDKYAERLLDANNELMRQLSPHSERLFERYGVQQFGPDVRLKNEHEFAAYVDKAFSAEQAQYYKKALQEKIYPLIEEKRRELIQEYVSTKIPSKELAKVRNQQNYINRYINKRFSPAVAKTYKEEVQRRVAAGCKRSVLPTPEYKIFGHAARHKDGESQSGEGHTPDAAAGVAERRFQTFECTHEGILSCKPNTDLNI